MRKAYDEETLGAAADPRYTGVRKMSKQRVTNRYKHRSRAGIKITFVVAKRY